MYWPFFVQDLGCAHGIAPGVEAIRGSQVTLTALQIRGPPESAQARSREA